MNSEYGIFRIFCIVSVVILCSLLITTGLLTAKYQTEQTVFGNTHSVIRMYEKKGGAVLNVNGKIAELEIKKIGDYFDILSFTLLAPVNNIIELGKTVLRGTG